MINQQFQRHAEYRDFSEDIKSCGQERKTEGMNQQRENLSQNRKQYCNRECQLEEPLITPGIIGNEVEVNSNGNSVKQQGNVNRELILDKSRQQEHEQNQTDADDE